MATRAISGRPEVGSEVRISSGVGYDWAMAILCAWLQFGGYLDTWGWDGAERGSEGVIGPLTMRESCRA